MTQVLQSKPVNSVKRISDHNLGLALVILINNSVQGYKDVGYSTLGRENPGLVQNLISDIIVYKANSCKCFSLQFLCFDAVKQSHLKLTEDMPLNKINRNLG